MFAILRRRLYKSVDGGDRWKLLTRGLGSCQHWLSKLALSPDYATDQTVFVSCRRGGIYRSEDGGRSWSGELAPDQDAVAMVMSPGYRQDRTVLALGDDGAVRRSTDAGSSWSEAIPADARIGALDWTGARAVAGSADGSLYLADDPGSSWSVYTRLPRNDRCCCGRTDLGITAVELTADGAIIVGTSGSGAYRVTGPDAVHRGVGLREDAHVTALATHVDGGGRMTLLAASSDDAVYLSDDVGGTWRRSASGVHRHAQAEEQQQPHFTRLAVSDDGVAFLGGFTGLFRSHDLGRTWTWLAPTIHHILALDVASLPGSGHAVALTHYGFGAYSTTDDGASWTIHDRDLPVTRLGPIAFSPDYGEDRTLFTASFGQILRSTDGGTGWTATELATPRAPRAGLLQRLRGRFTSPSPFPADARYYRPDDVIPVVLALSPSFSSDRTLFAGMWPNGVLRSTDGGDSFALVWGARGAPVRSLAVSPAYASDRSVFVTTWGFFDRSAIGLFRSRDGGDSWDRLAAELPLGRRGVRPRVALSPGFAADGTVYLTANGLFRSRDGGATWSELPLPAAARDLPISGLAVSPDYVRDATVVIQVEGGSLYLCRDGTDGFVARSSSFSDAGYESSQVFKRESAPLIRFSPRYPEDGTIYAASFHSLLKSTDRGATWVDAPRRWRRYEPRIRYDPGVRLPVGLRGGWRVDEAAELAAGATIYATRRGSRATLRFAGTGVRWIGRGGPGNGIALVSIDGVPVRRVDQYRDRPGPVEVTVGSLPPRGHTMTIEVTGKRSCMATGARIDVDAFDVFTSGAAP